MPTLKQLECHIEQHRTPNIRFIEYATRYTDGAVDTFIAVPNQATEFCLKLRTKGYIADGLGVYVFIDGEYQCNRNKIGLHPPEKHALRPGYYDQEFTFRQKEAYDRGSDAGSGHLIGRAWRFTRLQVDQADSQTTRPRDAGAVGSIVVVVLRCAKGDDASADKRVHSEVTQKASDNKNEPAPSNNKAPSIAPTQSVANSAVALSGIFGIFDGPADDRDGDPWGESRHGRSHYSPFSSPEPWLENDDVQDNQDIFKRTPRGSRVRFGPDTWGLPTASSEQDEYHQQVEQDGRKRKSKRDATAHTFQREDNRQTAHSEFLQSFSNDRHRPKDTSWSSPAMSKKIYDYGNGEDPWGLPGFPTHRTRESKPFRYASFGESDGWSDNDASVISNKSSEDGWDKFVEAGEYRDSSDTPKWQTKHSVDEAKARDVQSRFQKDESNGLGCRQKVEKTTQNGLKPKGHWLLPPVGHNPLKCDCPDCYRAQYYTSPYHQFSNQHQIPGAWPTSYNDKYDWKSPDAAERHSKDRAWSKVGDPPENADLATWENKGDKATQRPHNKPEKATDDWNSGKDTPTWPDSADNYRTGTDPVGTNSQSWDQGDGTAEIIGNDTEEKNKESSTAGERRDGEGWGNVLTFDGFDNNKSSPKQNEEKEPPYLEQQNKKNLKSAGNDIEGIKNTSPKLSESKKENKKGASFGEPVSQTGNGSNKDVVKPNENVSTWASKSNKPQEGVASAASKANDYSRHSPYIDFPIIPASIYTHAPPRLRKATLNSGKTSPRSLDKSESPSYEIPASVRDERHLDYQVRGGPEYHYQHRINKVPPKYVDSIEQPYARFVFHYRSRKTLEKMLGVGLKETKEEAKQRLAALSREEMLEQLATLAVQDLGDNSNTYASAPSDPPKGSGDTWNSTENDNTWDNSRWKESNTDTNGDQNKTKNNNNNGPSWDNSNENNDNTWPAPDVANTNEQNQADWNPNEEPGEYNVEDDATWQDTTGNDNDNTAW